MVYYSIDIYGEGDFEEGASVTVRSATYDKAVAKAKDMIGFFKNPWTHAHLIGMSPEGTIRCLADYGEVVVNKRRPHEHEGC